MIEEKWKISQCDRKMCDCRIITTESDQVVISDGAVNSHVANYIVSLHNGTPYQFDRKKWKTKECHSGSSCWCRLIINENDEEIVDYGALSELIANHIVNLHNNFIGSINEIS